jgi:beta-N-acetylhexosaminidase
VRRAGRALIVGLPGPELAADEAQLLRRLRPFGVIVFGRNLVEVEQTRRLVGAVREAAPEALLLADAEGGRVDRLKTLVGPAPAAAALATRPPAESRRAGRWVGEALRHFDLDVDLAPVVDLDHGASDNALDGRYFGRAPRAVVARARAFGEGLRSAGVGSCLKHFPGLGAARLDTHRAMATVALGAPALRRELAPFASLWAAAGAVMIAHAVYPALDPERLPATLSRAIATRLLRQRLGFRGVAIADDLEMGALAAWGDLSERAAAALAAGCDLLPVCSRLDAVPAVAARLLRAGLRDRLEEAAQRAATYRRRLLRQRDAIPRRTASLEAIRAGLAAMAPA